MPMSTDWTNEAVTGVAAGRIAEAPKRGPEYDRLEAFIGRWVTEGQTIASAGTPSAKITASDVYEWAPGGRSLRSTSVPTMAVSGRRRWTSPLRRRGDATADIPRSAGRVPSMPRERRAAGRPAALPARIHERRPLTEQAPASRPSPGRPPRAW